MQAKYTAHLCYTPDFFLLALKVKAWDQFRPAAAEGLYGSSSCPANPDETPYSSHE
jgi:hypothetical protein